MILSSKAVRKAFFIISLAIVIILVLPIVFSWVDVEILFNDYYNYDGTSYGDGVAYENTDYNVWIEYETHGGEDPQILCYDWDKATNTGIDDCYYMNLDERNDCQDAFDAMASFWGYEF